MLPRGRAEDRCCGAMHTGGRYGADTAYCGNLPIAAGADPAFKMQKAQRGSVLPRRRRFRRGRLSRDRERRRAVESADGVYVRKQPLLRHRLPRAHLRAKEGGRSSDASCAGAKAGICSLTGSRTLQHHRQRRLPGQYAHPMGKRPLCSRADSETGISPGRYGEAQDAANAVLFYAGERSACAPATP